MLSERISWFIGASVLPAAIWTFVYYVIYRIRIKLGIRSKNRSLIVAPVGWLFFFIIGFLFGDNTLESIQVIGFVIGIGLGIIHMIVRPKTSIGKEK